MENTRFRSRYLVVNGWFYGTVLFLAVGSVKVRVGGRMAVYETGHEEAGGDGYLVKEGFDV